MPEFTMVKTAMGDVRGLTQSDIEAIEKHNAWVTKREAGEFWKVKITRKRSLPLHRRFFLMLDHAFEHWQPKQLHEHKGLPVAKTPEGFRKDILILAGYGKPRYHIDGSVTFEAESISFDAMDDETFRKCYEAVHAVLLQHVLTNYSADDLENVLSELERFG
jgi:hypothetical protein